jgi:hypothetical protein
LTAWGLALAVAIVAGPIAVMVLGLVVFPIDFIAKMLGLGRAGGLATVYLRTAEAAFAPEGLPTWLPRIAVLVLGVFGLIAFAAAWMSANRRRLRGAFWWRLLRPPLSSAEALEHCWAAIWDLVRGAAPLEQPPPRELGRRYIELVGENIGQPRFRELLLAVHDLDAHRDLVFALVSESRRRQLVRRPTTEETTERQAEVFDLAGVARDYLVEVVGGALSVPVVTEPQSITFAPEAYWRGETHRVCDRPAAIARLVHECVELGAEQVVIVSAATETSGPHALTRPRLDGRGRYGEHLQSTEAATLRDVVRLASKGAVTLFTIRPTHNPVGPFDFAGGFDDRSDRRHPLDETMAMGYEDAYHQFIEPVVGGSGEQVGQS